MLLRKALLITMFVVLIGTPLMSQTPGIWAELFPEGLIDSNGNPVAVESLSGRYVGIYFAAGWCGGCQAFTPQMVPFRDNNAAEFEVVFVSLDRSEAAQFEYMKEYQMQWPALKHRSQPAQSLRQRFGVSSIPSLVVLAPDGSLITLQGQEDVKSNPSQALSLWKNAATLPLPGSSVALVDDSPAVQSHTRSLVSEGMLLSSTSQQGQIRGTIDSKSYFLNFDSSSSSITGSSDEKPFNVFVDKNSMTITGEAHGGLIDLLLIKNTNEYNLEGDIYGYFYWILADWSSNSAMGGAGCSILELQWKPDFSEITGFLGEKNVKLSFDETSGVITGHIFGRVVDLQLENLDMSEFLKHFYLFMR